MSPQPTVAYFSMEVGLDPAIPTYSGGLGALAGDSIRSAADMGVPLVAVTLLHRRGYFRQRLDPHGWQSESPVEWRPDDHLRREPVHAEVTIEGRKVRVGVWTYDARGVSGSVVPVHFLDTDLPENAPEDRAITGALYGGDSRYRLMQEVVLGVAGVRALRAMGRSAVRRFHMNEGHAALLTLELLAEAAGQRVPDPDAIEAVRRQCVFTTHTPVPAGHDKFPVDLVARVVEPRVFNADWTGPVRDAVQADGVVNLTRLALNLSHYVNGVAKRHGEVSRRMFSGHEIDSITNGVHAATWVVPPLASLYDSYIPGWRADNFSFRHAAAIPTDQLAAAHARAKEDLIGFVRDSAGVALDPAVFTIGFARRATAYKRADLVLSDLARLRRIHAEAGRVQIVFAGKAHPHDHAGKQLIVAIHEAMRQLHGTISIAYLENYGLSEAKRMTSGCDLWLNTPHPPLEASGTSGMKAALNAVPSLSVLDGWWLEGWIEGVTGWAVGPDTRGVDDPDRRGGDAASLYDQLERVIVPMFYKDPEAFRVVMRHAVAVNGSYFNTQRMMQEYVTKAYFD